MVKNERLKSKVRNISNLYWTTIPHLFLSFSRSHTLYEILEAAVLPLRARIVGYEFIFLGAKHSQYEPFSKPQRSEGRFNTHGICIYDPLEGLQDDHVWREPLQVARGWNLKQHAYLDVRDSMSTEVYSQRYYLL